MHNTSGTGGGPNPGPGVGTQAVLPPQVAQMGQPIAGKWPAIMKNGKVYVHRFHVEANKMANDGVIGTEDFYGVAELDAAGNVIDVSW